MYIIHNALSIHKIFSISISSLLILVRSGCMYKYMRYAVCGVVEYGYRYRDVYFFFVLVHITTRSTCLQCNTLYKTLYFARYFRYEVKQVSERKNERHSNIVDYKCTVHTYAYVVEYIVSIRQVHLYITRQKFVTCLVCRWIIDN